jgi:hypothetical protein
LAQISKEALAKAKARTTMGNLKSASSGAILANAQAKTQVHASTPILPIRRARASPAAVVEKAERGPTQSLTESQVRERTRVAVAAIDRPHPNNALSQICPSFATTICLGNANTVTNASPTTTDIANPIQKVCVRVATIVPSVILQSQLHLPAQQLVPLSQRMLKLLHQRKTMLEV